jgi:hypothetical protein
MMKGVESFKAADWGPMAAYLRGAAGDLRDARIKGEEIGLTKDFAAAAAIDPKVLDGLADAARRLGSVPGACSVDLPFLDPT